MRLDERTAVVTGATRGVGRGVGRELAAHGARVFITGRSTPEPDQPTRGGMMCGIRNAAGVAMAYGVAVFLGADLHAQDSRPALMQAKEAAYDLTIRNDQAGLQAVIREFDRLAGEPGVTASALYHAGWARWQLAASEIVAGEPDSATRTLLGAVEDLTRALALHPDDPDTHALLAWVLTAIASADRSKWDALRERVVLHRRRALELGPDNPRVVMMDATMLFYAPPQAGGGQERGIARWMESLTLFEKERHDNPLKPDWGGALAYGWLANLHLSSDPPNHVLARKFANAALEMRPDFWWVRTQVLPRIEP